MPDPSHTLDGLPKAPFGFLEEDSNLPGLPAIERSKLAGCLGTAHATELCTFQSVTGLIALVCCAAVAWKSRAQLLVATSTTEAKLHSAVTFRKTVKRLSCAPAKRIAQDLF
jgi:hypothetical protein